MAALHVRELGDYIRDQRRAAHISLRQLAQQAGVSNPYLSQIERGLRKPSAEILQQIAKALRISAEVLYVQAGILEEREGGEDVHAAVLADEVLTARQKQVILDIYDAFRRENAAAEDLAASTVTAGDEAVAPAPAAETPPAKAEPAPVATRRRTSPAAAETGGTTGNGTTEPAVTRRPAARRPPRAAATAEPGETAGRAPRRATTTRRTTTRRATTAGPDPAKPAARASSDAPAGVPAGSVQPDQASTSEP